MGNEGYGITHCFSVSRGSVRWYISSTHRREYSFWISVSPLTKHTQNNLILGNLISNHLCTQLAFMERKRAYIFLRVCI